ncbi:MAG: hypothetical protein K0U68_00530 [Gammaproteobacteria bacterium]|nr:hypothetical protein [Gammaproteobacteria bacterium]
MSQLVVAHESRIITNGDGDQLRITVGNSPEPVFEDQLVRTDLFLNQIAPDGETLIPIDVSAGASIADLKAYVMSLKDEVHVTSFRDRPVRRTMELHDISQVRGTENRYQSPLIYTRDGAYGFRYVGTIITNDGTQFDIDEFFVCGGGSQAEPRDDGSIPAFGCVREPITFP